VTQDNLLIITAQPEFLEAAVNELKIFDKRLTIQKLLAPGIALCEDPDVQPLMHMATREKPIFVRHLAPVQATIQLENSDKDFGTLAIAIADLPTFSMLERGTRFAVQTRLVQSEENSIKRNYSGGQLNQQLAAAIVEETGAVESIKRPQIVVSILGAADKAYIGISDVTENVSAWPGGMRHFAQTQEQLSRAEFKLLEALETFEVEFPDHGLALDLGAAPGGWSRLLLEAGMNVVAVDPANLDQKLMQHPRLKHYQDYAENFLEEAVTRKIRFDIITNDMRMDAREAARLLIPAGRCLKPEGFVISVLKLPHTTQEINPLKTLKAALKTLQSHYGVVQAHQLFHNRQEVTVIAARPTGR
jgi:23S rRNA (cytidine2498-2'-O)-methyltransferase